MGGIDKIMFAMGWSLLKQEDLYFCLKFSIIKNVKIIMLGMLKEINEESYRFEIHGFETTWNIWEYILKNLRIYKSKIL